jgi:hypothetical protein
MWPEGKSSKGISFLLVVCEKPWLLKTNRRVKKKSSGLMFFCLQNTAWESENSNFSY